MQCTDESSRSYLYNVTTYARGACYAALLTVAFSLARTLLAVLFEPNNRRATNDRDSWANLPASLVPRALTTCLTILFSSLLRFMFLRYMYLFYWSYFSQYFRLSFYLVPEFSTNIFRRIRQRGYITNNMVTIFENFANGGEGFFFKLNKHFFI